MSTTVLLSNHLTNNKRPNNHGGPSNSNNISNSNNVSNANIVLDVNKMDDIQRSFLKKTLMPRHQQEEEYKQEPLPSDVISFNVAGDTKVAVLRRTLTHVEGSLLQTKFSGRWDHALERDGEGRVFVNYPSKSFVDMIHHLQRMEHQTPNCPPLTAPEPTDDLCRLLEYYGITKVVYPIKVKILDSSCNRNKDENKESKTKNEGKLEAKADSFGGWFSVWAKDTTTFSLVQVAHHRSICAFEVQIMEDCEVLDIGVRTNGSGVQSYRLDCKESVFIRNGGKPKETDVAIPRTELEEGCLIRCEWTTTNNTVSWFVDGYKIHSTKGGSFTRYFEPELRLKGRLKVVNVQYRHPSL